MPGRPAGTAVSFYGIVVDAHDLPSLARFWCQVLDWEVLFEADDEIVIGADKSAVPGITFVPVPEKKTVKNRLHIDLAPDDQAVEVERIIGLGARRVDIGQRADVSRVLPADPEGNDFCVLTPKNSLID
ncbi:VOC family protein [Streptomyces atratus]|uniref:VOC family protein n=1 Tax=Streptomyces atratus TaxID=1893 RepID=UPI003674DE06